MSRTARKCKEESDMYFNEADILTSRPKDMEYDEYKARMRAQKKIIKQYLKGEMVHLSKLYPHQAILDKFKLPHNPTKQDIIDKAVETQDSTIILLLTGNTYRRDKDGQ